MAIDIKIMHGTSKIIDTFATYQHALAYFSKHRPAFPIHRVMASLPDEQHYTQTLAAARWVVRQVQDQSERLVGPLEYPKGEPVDLD